MVVVSVFGRVGEQWQDWCRRLGFLCVCCGSRLALWRYGGWRGSVAFQCRAVVSSPDGLNVRKWGGGGVPLTASGGCIHLPLLPHVVAGFLLAVFRSVGSVPTTSGLPGKAQLCVNSGLVGLCSQGYFLIVETNVFLLPL